MDTASRTQPVLPFIWAKGTGPVVEGVPFESVLGIHTIAGEQTIMIPTDILSPAEISLA
jgi:hypothetical protein